MFDYFYGIQSEQFAFYRIPKVLFTDDRFRVLSAEAKTLYGILLDRVTLSAKNGWIDQLRTASLDSRRSRLWTTRRRFMRRNW